MKEKIQKLIENKYGKIKWDGQMGYGEGIITCEVVVNGETIKGISGGDCTSLEALINLAGKLNIKLGI